MPLVVLILLAACGVAQAPPAATQAATPEEEVLSILLAAAEDVRAALVVEEVVLDTTSLESRHRAPVAAALGARPGHRNEVLHCAPPICRLDGAGALVQFWPPSQVSNTEARVLVQVWTEGAPRTGAATVAFTLIVVRDSAHHWRVASREPRMAS
jgi:hypothetical protein